MTGLRLVQLTKCFGTTVACADVTLDVQSGEILGLLGPSGCGKTTILRCIAGFERPTSGEIWVQDRLVSSSSLTTPPEKRNVGMVFQSYALWPHLTVSENVEMPLRLRGVAKAERREAVGAALQRLGLGGAGYRYPSELSGGQQQRVALARATIGRPSLLLLDEPLSSLDPALREDLREELRDQLKELGHTTVFVTHDQDEAMSICDRIALLCAGRLVQVGTPKELYDHPYAAFAGVFLGRANVVRGRIIDRDNDYFTVQVAEGLCLLAVGHEDMTVGTDVAVLIRPEDVTTTGGRRDVNRLKGLVLRSVFLGRRIEYVADVNGVPVRFDLPVAQEIENRTELDLAVPYSRTYCFSPEKKVANAPR